MVCAEFVPLLYWPAMDVTLSPVPTTLVHSTATILTPESLSKQPDPVRGRSIVAGLAVLAIAAAGMAIVSADVAAMATVIALIERIILFLFLPSQRSGTSGAHVNAIAEYGQVALHKEGLSAVIPGRPVDARGRVVPRVVARAAARSHSDAASFGDIPLRAVIVDVHRLRERCGVVVFARD